MDDDPPVREVLVWCRICSEVGAAALQPGADFDCVPCPHCGHAAAEVIRDDDDDSEGEPFYV